LLFETKGLYLSEITIIYFTDSMNMKKQIIFPKHYQLLETMGENIKLARKRRKLTTVQVAERAGIARSTLYLIEKGESSVTIGA